MRDKKEHLYKWKEVTAASYMVDYRNKNTIRIP